MSRKKSEHYRSKVEKSFFELNGREPTREDRAKRWEGKPPIPNYLGDCFLKIATHLSYKPNFVNYMFRDDMISDGIENCVQYIHNFDPEKSKNPFAYFTQIIHYAFRESISKSRRQVPGLASRLLQGGVVGKRRDDFSDPAKARRT